MGGEEAFFAEAGTEHREEGTRPTSPGTTPSSLVNECYTKGTEVRPLKLLGNGPSE